MTSAQEGIEPELLQPTPRKVKFLGFWSVPVSTAICGFVWLTISAVDYSTNHSRTPLEDTAPSSFVVLIFVGLVYYSINFSRAWGTSLLINGVATRVTILGKWKYTTRGGTSYWMKYSFETGNAFPVEMESDVGGEAWYALNPGDKATLLYDPQQPSKNKFYLSVKGNYKIG